MYTDHHVDNLIQAIEYSLEAGPHPMGYGVVRQRLLEIKANKIVEVPSRKDIDNLVQAAEDIMSTGWFNEHSGASYWHTRFNIALAPFRPDPQEVMRKDVERVITQYYRNIPDVEKVALDIISVMRGHKDIL
jgi:hypothetical protein